MSSNLKARLNEGTEAIEQQMQARRQARETKAVGEAPSRPSHIPATGPGRLLQTSGEIILLQDEIADLKKKIEQWDGSMPTVRLDPNLVVLSPWANRHEDSFKKSGFSSLKESIQDSDGNIQPILVRRLGPDKYELVFGHRRHRACLELEIPVLAVVWEKELTDRQLYLAMHRENRDRADLSAYEQGKMFKMALAGDPPWYDSERSLAEALKVSRTWIAKTLKIANLPEAILGAFESPLLIKPAHAEVIIEALATKQKQQVLLRAEKIRQMSPRPAASKVVALLIAADEAKGATALKHEGRKLGTWRRNGHGRVVLELEPGLVGEEQLKDIGAFIAKLSGE